MKKTILLIMVALVAMSVPAMSARVVNVPIPHPPFELLQAYCGQTGRVGTDTDECLEAGNRAFQGVNLGADVITAVPGVLAIDPGTNWSNFVSAAAANVAYTVTNVTMRKTVPEYVCMVKVGGPGVLQQGSTGPRAVRLWWPLMYEIPGTEWTLTITYRTAAPWIDPANTEAVTTHTDIWKWEMVATLDSLENLIELFHELPAGSSQVPLINSGGGVETFFAETLAALDILQGMDPNDPEMSILYNEFILMIENHCLIGDCTTLVGQSEVGIRNSVENPACCKILADLDAIADDLGLMIASK